MVDSGVVSPVDFDTVVPFAQIRDAVVVEASVNGEPGRYLLDTGANITVVDRLPLEGQVISVGGAGSAEESMVTSPLAMLALGDVVFEGTYVASGNLQDLTRSIDGLRGLIGQPVLSKADWLIDYEAASLRLSASLEPEAGMVELPVRYRRGLPYVTLSIDGQRVDALVDTGASSHLVIPEDSDLAEALRSRYAFAPNERQIFAIGGTRTVSQSVAMIPELTVGGQRFTKVIVELRETRRPRLGARFFSEREQVLLQRRGSLWVRP